MMISMSKGRLRGLMSRKGMAHVRNYICKRASWHVKCQTLRPPHQMQSGTRYLEMNNETGAASFKAARASFSEQREKWMATAKEMQRKAMLAAKGSVPRASRRNQSLQGKANWQQQQQPPQKNISSSAEAQHKFWMSPSEIQKQKRLLKELSGRQQASKIESNSAAARVEATLNSNPPAELEELQKKSPERLAYLKAIQQLNSYHAFDLVPGPDPIMEHTLERIPVIQISGSRGRAATCGLVQNILLAHGIRTGLLCSLHLFFTSERIRIDGKPLSAVQFAKLFWKIHSGLDKMQPAPSYNQLLTLMACHAFRQANVDVAIVELVSGGANITSHARTIGISSTLGSNLGPFLRDIAGAKAAASIYTNSSQAEGWEVLSQQAKEMGVKLHRVPTFNALTEANPSHKHLLTRANNCVKLHGSLGIQLAYDYLRRHKPESVVGLGDTVQLSQDVIRGIETFQPAGHFDVIKHDILNVYLDTADSVESMLACRDWFHSRTRASRAPKLLLYTRANGSNAKDPLTILHCNVRFDEACFVPCPSFFEGEFVAEDQSTAMVWHDKKQLQRARSNAKIWRHLCEACGRRDTSHITISLNSFFEHALNKYGTRNEVDVLVTGSRQLVAAAIATLNKMRGSAPPKGG